VPEILMLEEDSVVPTKRKVGLRRQRDLVAIQRQGLLRQRSVDRDWRQESGSRA
jgi:hypothetical protein